jgi:hypothetical protein
MGLRPCPRSAFDEDGDVADDDFELCPGPVAGTFLRQPARRDELMYEVIRSLEFRPVASWAFAGECHIGIREAMSLRTVCKRLGKRESTWDIRVLCLVDALAIRSAFTRGRSSSRILNGVMKTTLPYTLPTGVAPLVPWIPSAENTADDPTRHKRIRAPAPLTERAAAALKLIGLTHPRPLRFARASRGMLAARAGAAATALAGVRAHGFAAGPLRLLDLCAGVSAPLCAAAADRGWVCEPIDVMLKGVEHDLSVRKVVDDLEVRILDKEFDLTMIATPCGTFSCWMRMSPSSSRSTAQPWGGARGRPLTKK